MLHHWHEQFPRSHPIQRVTSVVQLAEYLRVHWEPVTRRPWPEHDAALEHYIVGWPQHWYVDGCTRVLCFESVSTELPQYCAARRGRDAPSAADAWDVVRHNPRERLAVAVKNASSGGPHLASHSTDGCAAIRALYAVDAALHDRYCVRAPTGRANGSGADGADGNAAPASTPTQRRDLATGNEAASSPMPMPMPAPSIDVPTPAATVASPTADAPRDDGYIRPVACAAPRRIALLLVGLVGGTPEAHMHATSRLVDSLAAQAAPTGHTTPSVPATTAVPSPPCAACVFAVGEGREMSALSVLTSISTNLAALSLVSPLPLQRPSYLPAGTAFRVLRPPAGSSAPSSPPSSSSVPIPTAHTATGRATGSMATAEGRVLSSVTAAHRPSHRDHHHHHEHQHASPLPPSKHTHLVGRPSGAPTLRHHHHHESGSAGAQQPLAGGAAIAASSLKVRDGAKLQWHKLRHAWEQMVALEGEVNQRFDVVLKLRFDATPLLPFHPCLFPPPPPPPTTTAKVAATSATTNASLVVYAASDKIFWGARAAMAVAIDLHEAIGTEVFEGTSRRSSHAISHAISLHRLLDAATAIPPAAWSTVRELRQHYNKVAMLPFPRLTTSRLDMHAADPRGHTLGHIRAAIDAHVDTIAPYRTVAATAELAAVPALPPQIAREMKLIPGLRSSALDRSPEAFVAERDFLLWLLWHKVSVCDLGAGSDAILYKGMQARRPSMRCNAHAPVDAPTSDRAGDGRGVALRPHIHIRYGSRADGRLSFMLAPIIRTLVLGLNVSGVRLNVAAVGSDAPAASALSQHARTLGRRDAFIWVGVKQHGTPPWAEMRRHGVRTIFYQTEPMPASGGCMIPPMRRPSSELEATPLVDEVWDYSEVNLQLCARVPHAPTLRFLPPGAITGATNDVHATAGARATTGSKEREPLDGGGGAAPQAIFLGDVTLDERARCFTSLRPLVRAVNDVWSESALRRLVASTPPPLFINLHKKCMPPDGRQPLESVRLSQLLTLGALVVSQHAHERDEARYEGLVDFVSLAEMPQAIRKLQQRTDLADLAAERAARFRERFEPRALVTRALAQRFLS